MPGPLRAAQQPAAARAAADPRYSEFVQISHAARTLSATAGRAAARLSAEIVGNQNDEIGAAGPGTLARPVRIDCCYWRRLCAGLAQFTERIQECENG